MTDNVSITQGTGTTIATDDISGVHYQRFKLSVGADGSATDLTGGSGATAAGTPRVVLATDDPAVTSLAIMDDWDDGADRLKVSQDGAVSLAVSVAARPANTTAYAVGDVWNANGSTAALAVTNAVALNGRAVRIEDCTIYKSSATLTNASFVVHVFDRDPGTLPADNSTVNASQLGVLSVADVNGYLGSFIVTCDIAGTAGATGRGLPQGGRSGITVKPNSGTSFYIVIELNGVYTPASGETMTVTFGGSRF